MKKSVSCLLEGMYIIRRQQAGVTACDLCRCFVQQMQAFPLQHIEKFNKVVVVCPGIFIFKDDVGIDCSVVQKSVRPNAVFVLIHSVNLPLKPKSVRSQVCQLFRHKYIIFCVYRQEIGTECQYSVRAGRYS